MEFLLCFIIFVIYYFIGIKIANKLGTRDSYEQHIVACLFPVVLSVLFAINIFYFVKEKKE